MDKQGFGRRLARAMAAAGYDPKPSVLAREFNERYLGEPVTLHGVRRWLLGEVMPTEDKLAVLARWLNADPEELRVGKKAVKSKASKQAYEQARWAREREIFEVFLSLRGPQKKIVREVIVALARMND